MSDQQTYVKIGAAQSGRKSYQILNGKYLELFMNLNLVDKVELRSVMAKENGCSRIYGVLKDHKENMPMR